MHKLDRASVPAPACLADYNHTTHTWDDVAAPCKRTVRASLEQMQGGPRCAYCEGTIHPGHGHIEHFRRKNPHDFPQLTFAWDNLFLSCDDQDHCGHYKDRRAAPDYRPDDLIKPDVEDPDDFLYFHSDGKVCQRSGIQADRARRADETIRVFGLDAGPLRAARRRAAKSYLSYLKSKSGLDLIEELRSWTKNDREDYIRDEIERTAFDPHATVIRHLLVRALP